MNYEIKVSESMQWGKLYGESFTKRPGKGLRIAIFGSTTAGHLLLDSLLKYSAIKPGSIDIRGIATDDPLDPEARISLKKRVWRYYSPMEKQKLFDLMLDRAMKEKICLYSGAVKNSFFRSLLKSWDPQLIIMCCFGQKVDNYIFNYPARGMYNFHPSDLSTNIGAGAKPFEETIHNGKDYSRLILHRVNDIIDGGPIVGISPKVKIVNEDGLYPQNILLLQEKIPAICGWMGISLVKKILTDNNNKFFIDFEKCIPESIKSAMLRPISDGNVSNYRLPLHPDIIKKTEQ